MTENLMKQWLQYNLKINLTLTTIWWKFNVTLTQIWMKVLCNIDYNMTESLM